MPQPGVCARLVSGCVPGFGPAIGEFENRLLAQALRVALILSLASVFGCFAQARELAAADEPAKSSSSSTNQAKPDISADSRSKTDEKSDAEKTHKNEEAPPPSPPPAPPPHQKRGRPFPTSAPNPGQLYSKNRYNVEGTDIQETRDRSFLHPGINHPGEISFFNNEPGGISRRFEVL